MGDRNFIDPEQFEAAYLEYVIHTNEASLARLVEMFEIIARHTFDPRKTPYLRDMRQEAIVTATTDQWRCVYGFDAARMPIRKTFGTALVGFFRGCAIRSFIDQNITQQGQAERLQKYRTAYAAALGVDPNAPADLVVNRSRQLTSPNPVL